MAHQHVSYVPSWNTYPSTSQEENEKDIHLGPFKEERKDAIKFPAQMLINAGAAQLRLDLQIPDVRQHIKILVTKKVKPCPKRFPPPIKTPLPIWTYLIWYNRISNRLNKQILGVF
jgi:hypothetical protein